MWSAVDLQRGLGMVRADVVPPLVPLVLFITCGRLMMVALGCWLMALAGLVPMGMPVRSRPR